MSRHGLELWRIPQEPCLLQGAIIFSCANLRHRSQSRCRAALESRISPLYFSTILRDLTAVSLHFNRGLMLSLAKIPSGRQKGPDSRFWRRADNGFSTRTRGRGGFESRRRQRQVGGERLRGAALPQFFIDSEWDFCWSSSGG